MTNNMRIGTNYRLYTFINFYLSSIQMGIQSAHIISELFTKYKNANDKNIGEYTALYNWAKTDKTIIVLNGGTSFDIRQDYIDLSTQANKCKKFVVPFAFFQEDHNALGIYENGVVTGFGVVVPEEMWASEIIDNSDYIAISPPKYTTLSPDFQPIYYREDEPETKIIDLIKSKPLAR